MQEFRCCSKSRSGFQPDTPDKIGIYRSIGINRIFSTKLKCAHRHKKDGMKKPAIILALSIINLLCSAAQNVMPWKMKDLNAVPAVYDGAGYATNGVKGLFFEGVPFKGKPTRVFAYYGIPEGASAKKKVPAMVLVHGGGGSAFHRWVKMWVDRGYAAISMDTCGAISGNGYNNHKRHDFSGPAGWGDFTGVDKPIEDQWTYHAVAAVTRAHSLLRSWEGVDADRIGITGISWGGYLTCISASVDKRYKFAAPVYGCGFLGE